MKLKYAMLAVLSLFVLALCGCGSSGGAGLNGGVAVTATATGSVINATATYTNPSQTNLIGVPIAFTVQIGGNLYDLGTHKTNNTGSVGVAFTPPAFNGSQTVTVIAKTDNLTNFASISMVGRALTVTPPPALALTTTLPAGSSLPFVIPPAGTFVAITDPFTNDVSGHLITVTSSVVATNSGDTLTPPTATTTTSAGTAPFPGASGTLVVPATVGGTETMTITWTVTDTVTGQFGTGITTVTLSKAS
jgi:hypothetical protein